MKTHTNILLLLLCLMFPLFGNEDTPPPQYLYKVISPEAWEQSQQQAQVVGTSIDADFMHLAKEDQVQHVVQKFWQNQNYVILKLDPKKFEGRLVYEKNRGGTTYYYHLYGGKIPLSAVVEVQKKNDSHNF